MIHARERVERKRGHRVSLMFDDGLVYWQKLVTSSAEVMEGRARFANHQSVSEKRKKASIQESQISSVALVLQRLDRSNGQDGQRVASEARSVYSGQDNNTEEA